MPLPACQLPLVPEKNFVSVAQKKRKNLLAMAQINSCSWLIHFFFINKLPRRRQNAEKYVYRFDKFIRCCLVCKRHFSLFLVLLNAFNFCQVFKVRQKVSRLQKKINRCLYIVRSANELLLSVLEIGGQEKFGRVSLKFFVSFYLLCFSFLL